MNDELFDEPHHKVYQDPRSRYLENHQNDLVDPPKNRTRFIRILGLLTIGFVLGYGYYYIRIRGIL
jgi:hypothetical protein